MALSDNQVVIDKYPNPSKDLGQTYYDGEMCIRDRIGISRNSLLAYLDALHDSCLTMNLQKEGSGISRLQKPDKLFLENQMCIRDRTCTGIVKDATGEGVIGASVVVKGTTNGTITGLDGDFSLSNVDVYKRQVDEREFNTLVINAIEEGVSGASVVVKGTTNGTITGLSLIHI